MRTLHYLLACSAILVSCSEAWQWPDPAAAAPGPPQIPFSWPHRRPSPPQQQPQPDSTIFLPKKQTLKLQHILAHGAPGAKSAKVFRRLAIDHETRLQMAQVNSLLAAESPSPGSTFEHSVSDTFFPMDGSEYDDDYNDNDDKIRSQNNNNAFPLPWKRAPNAEDHATVVSMVRMALDCYVDPKRQGWVDIGDNWDVSTEIGWLEAGLRGYVFASEDQKTVVIGIKGTSLKLFGTGGGPTGNNDKLNDNKMFSCCCGKVDRTWWGVCGCYMGGNSCNQQCLVDDAKKDLDESESYYGIGLKVVEAAKSLYPYASIWMTGHSLGGSVASLLGIRKGYPVFTYSSPGDARYGQKVGLVKPNLKESDLEKMPVWQFGHTGDPIYMGTCNGATSSCYSAGYAMETKCHLGRTCVYDTMTELGWRQNIQGHTIFKFISVVENWYNMTKGREEVPKCLPQTDCQDCVQWQYV
ncbi:putative lipase atg15 [Linnemannia schmuckeri]|uniref:triacylglycerol lipase n=1 Tax=Linnemannia schmuckeri TaxID=64567 RepID=A0A9P5RXU0_9FUNG|nr:putative lipase atg15 [Linnemannia schmuckeri]